MKCIKCFSVIFLFIFSQNIFSITINLKQKITADKEYIYLYDIGEIKDGSAENKILFESPNMSRAYNIKDLYKYITKAIGNEDYIVIGENITIEVSPKTKEINIQNQSAYDTPEKKTMSDAILMKLPLPEEKDEYYKITYLYKTPNVDINTNEYILDAVLSDSKKQGTQNIRFNIKNKKGENVNWFETVVEIYKMKTVYVAKMNYEKGSIVVSDNFEKKEFRANRIPNDSISDIGKADGSILSYHVQKGNILREFHIKNDYTIKKGDTVRAILNRNGVYVEIDAVASEDGYDGKKIKIKNKTTGKDIQGYVKGNAVYVSK